MTAPSGYPLVLSTESLESSSIRFSHLCQGDDPFKLIFPPVGALAKVQVRVGMKSYTMLFLSCDRPDTVAEYCFLPNFPSTVARHRSNIARCGGVLQILLLYRQALILDWACHIPACQGHIFWIQKYEVLCMFISLQNIQAPSPMNLHGLKKKLTSRML